MPGIFRAISRDAVPEPINDREKRRLSGGCHHSAFPFLMQLENHYNRLLLPVKELKIIRRIEYPKCYIPSTNYRHLGLAWHPQRPSATRSSSFDCGAVPHLPFKINYPAHDCAIQHPQNPFQFLGFRRLRGQLNPASPCIPDALFFPWQPVKPIPLESELWCWTDPRPLPQYFRFRKGPRARYTYAAGTSGRNVFQHPTSATMYRGRHHRVSSASTR
ncbi:hypothetical protein DFH08DRAFT_824945 [Mycena albidolilacea]|uniref:Uncharacterized protein n=1 Tax=Mycena albidolilacea TaxID=1033008 RepID=A0AAD7E9T1_9AGAR|nr:hypothetical protein DFH08DRAFT_824945 [Mycena albidolilacea]